MRTKKHTHTEENCRNCKGIVYCCFEQYVKRNRFLKDAHAADADMFVYVSVCVCV